MAGGVVGGVTMEYFDWSSLGHVPMPGPVTVAEGNGVLGLVHLGNMLLLWPGREALCLGASIRTTWLVQEVEDSFSEKELLIWAVETLNVH